MKTLKSKTKDLFQPDIFKKKYKSDHLEKYLALEKIDEL